MSQFYNPLDYNYGAMPRWGQRVPERRVRLEDMPEATTGEPETVPADESTKALPSPEARADNRLIETDFAELADGTLIELIEHPVPKNYRFAIWQAGETRIADRFESNGQVFVPPTRDRSLLESMVLPTGVESYRSPKELVAGVESLIAQCISLNPGFLPVLANFVVSTWFVDRFVVAPYLSVVGLPQSGKTTLLRLLSLVTRRSLLTADISPASFYKACSRFMPTILIDETATVARNRAVRHMLRSGTTRDVLALQTDGSLHSFGAKAFTWLELPDDPALNSRCIIISMTETISTTLLSTDDPKIPRQASILRDQLLRFRLDSLHSIRPRAIAGDEVLRPRTRDLFRAVAAPTSEDAVRCQGLLKLFQSGQAAPSEPLSPEQNAVLHLLFLAVHAGEEYSSIWVSELTKKANLYLKERGEGVQLQPRKLGAVLTSLGFSDRKRTNSGWNLRLSREDAERVHQLVANYGIDGFDDRYMLAKDRQECPMCKAAGLDKSGPDLPPGTASKEVDLLARDR